MTDAQNVIIAMDARLDLNVTRPMKNALNSIAQMRQISMSDVVRQALLAGLPFAYPEWSDIHDRQLEIYISQNEVNDDRPATAA